MSGMFRYEAIATSRGRGGSSGFDSARTALTRLTPPAQTGAFFGVYALSGAATAWLSPLLVNIGTRLGRVTDRVGRVPIVNDFHEQLERLDLEEFVAREKVCSYVLDKRQALDAARSAFLHRLVFLGLEIGSVQREAAPLGQSIFKEHWRVRWNQYHAQE